MTIDSSVFSTKAEEAKRRVGSGIGIWGRFGKYLKSYRQSLTVGTVAIVGGALTGRDYDHIQISSLDMVYDVLCSPREYADLPQPGNIISGQFWLSALVWPERLPGYWESAQTWDDVLLALLERMDAR